MRLFILLISLTALSGCLTVTTPSGFTAKGIKMPLIDTIGTLDYEHEWLTEDNTLHNERLIIGVDTSTQNQLKAFEAGAAIAAGKGM